MAGQVLMEDDVIEPLPAASLLLIRDDPFEVLMLRRHEKSSFVPNAWVFPGGIVEASDHEIARVVGDGSTATAMKIAAARETFEEAGVWLGLAPEDAPRKRRQLLAGNLPFRSLVEEIGLALDRLVLTSRWITPVGLPKRFDTWFFIAAAGRDVAATAEHNEAVEVQWIAPATALARHRERRMEMVFPTLRNLEAIAGFESCDELLESRRGARVEPVLPLLVDGKPVLR